MLIEELGLEPTPALRQLEQAILTHDASLQVPAVASTSRLHAPPTRTIGRDADRRAIVALLGRDDVRLVTLVGPGGPWDVDGDVAGQLEHHFFAPARAHYGERPWDEGRAAGTRMSVEEGIALALSPGESAS